MSPIATGGPPHTRSTSINGGGPVSTMKGSTAGGNSTVMGRPYAHLDDLTTVELGVDINSPIRRILQDAELLAKQADTHIDFRRPDIALQEYIKAFTLATDIIPRHKDYPSLSSSQSDLHRSYMGLLKRLNAQQSRFDEAKRIIKEDNERSGVRALAAGKENAISTNGTSGLRNGLSNGNSITGNAANGAHRTKPPVQPKPDALHGKALHPPGTPNSASSPSDLASRFARLRTPPVQDPRIRTQPISIPADSEGTANPTLSSSTTVRPLGPREMPPVPTSAPRQIRMPIDVKIPEMPKPPDAIYSPSRNPDSAATINFPTSSPRSSSYIGKGNNAAPPVSTVGRTPSLDGRQEYFSPAHKMSDTGPRRSKLILSDTSTVSASQLTEYIRMGSQNLRMLLVDVRSREDFDEGHIMSTSIICIEPITLRTGMSSEELMESLVLSPESELGLYERRHEFDLVVFYDQRSMSHKGQTSDASYLETFSRAMYEYGYDKQLQRRPRLLLGGLDAWTDLMGPSSLQSSSTGSISSKKSNGVRNKSARPLGRVPKAREPYKFIARKRTFESRPLSKEEESKWDETLREHPTHGNKPAIEQDDTDELSYIRTTEDFFRRYPELPTIQESMISARQAPPTNCVEPFNTIPPPPARPAPTLPRQKSSGVLEKTPSADYAMMSSNTGITTPGPPPGLCGLRNNGVSCYVNAVVQCLSASAPLRNQLKGFTPSRGTMVPIKYNSSETTVPPQLLVRNFGNLLGHMWSGQYDYVAPNTFLGYVNAIHMASMPRNSLKIHAFGGSGRQHDSSEFLMFLIVLLHDEMNKKRDKPDYQRQKQDITDAQTEGLSDAEKDDFLDPSADSLDTRDAIRQEWRLKLAADDSVLSNSFYGMDVQLIKCTRHECGYLNKKWREFSILQMNFPPKYTVPGSKFPTISLTEIFRHSFNLETLEQLDDYKCAKCKFANVCVQDRAVTYLPDYIILEFSRFQVNQYDPSQDPTQRFQTGKIKTQITFNEKVDLKPIFIPVDSPSSRDDDQEDVRGCVEPFIYDCYGIIMHRGGSIQSGHYMAMTRNLDKPGQIQNRWHHFNDQEVKLCDFSAAFQSDRQVTHMFLKRRRN